MDEPLFSNPPSALSPSDLAASDLAASDLRPSGLVAWGNPRNFGGTLPQIMLLLVLTLVAATSLVISPQQSPTAVAGGPGGGPNIGIPEIWLSGPTDGEPIIGPLTCTTETSIIGDYTVQLGTGTKVLEVKTAWTEVLEFTLQTHQFQNGPLELFANLVDDQGQVVATSTLEIEINNPEVTVVDVTSTSVELQIAGLPDDCVYALFVGGSNAPSYSTQFGWLPISDYAYWDCGLFPMNYDGTAMLYNGQLSAPPAGASYVVLLTWSMANGWTSSFVGQL